jgi:hypothetical protein
MSGPGWTASTRIRKSPLVSTAQDAPAKSEEKSKLPDL